MLLRDFRPRSQLVSKTTRVERPRFPVIDMHNHLGEPFGGGWDRKPLSELLDVLDEAGVTLFVDLDGGWGEEILCTHLKYFKERAAERFQIFGGVAWKMWESLGDKFPKWAAGQLRVQQEAGAQGLKVWKDFGLHVKDADGKLVKVDDERLDPLWETAAELALPVMIHIGDPPAFFEPIDETNERMEELGNHPEWAFPSPPFPPYLELMDGFKNLVLRHSHTTFIGAHVGCYAENLGWVGRMLDECPNYYIDISARLGDLGRQPYTARKFFLEHQNRILFGLDMGPDLEAYRLGYRLLETEDEYFNYSPGNAPLQGRWHAYGLYLPDDVLEKVYKLNARRALGME